MEVLEPIPAGLGRREMLDRLKGAIQPATERLEREGGFEPLTDPPPEGEDCGPA